MIRREKMHWNSGFSYYVDFGFEGITNPLQDVLKIRGFTQLTFVVTVVQNWHFKTLLLIKKIQKHVYISCT